MNYAVAKDYLNHNIRCNCISPARVHTPFVDGYLRKNYPGREKKMFEQLSQAQPIGRMGEPREVAALALFLCSEEASFITGVDYPLDGGFVNLRSFWNCDQMDLQIKDKVVLVTGGAKGIGAAIVRTCANEGALPVIVDRDAEAGRRLQAELNGHGIASEVIPVDLLAAGGCSQAVEQT